MRKTRYRPPQDRPPFPGPLRQLILLYLATSVAALATLLFDIGEASGIFLVIFALPWSLLVGQLSALLGSSSVILNLALLSIGIGVNAGLLYLLGRWMSARSQSQPLNRNH